jgi:hypothetical protein
MVISLCCVELLRSIAHTRLLRILGLNDNPIKVKESSVTRTRLLFLELSSFRSTGG